MQTPFEQHKFTVTITRPEPQAIPLGGQSALIFELFAVNGNAHVKQWVRMALSPEFLYTLTFTASEENFACYRSQFDKVKQSIVFK